MSAISETKIDKFHEWGNILRGFEILVTPANAKSQLIPQLKQLLDEFDHQQDGWREEQKLRADDFNILRTMRLTRKELCHSDVLETNMNATRERYNDLFAEIHESVKQIHPELDRIDIHLSPIEIQNWGGSVVYSKAVWPSDWATWRTGFYISNISLDELASDKSPEPNVSIFFQGSKNDKRIEDMRHRITRESPRVFKRHKINSRYDDEDNRTLLWFQIPEGKNQLLKMLFGGKEKQFEDCIANHIKLMCGFIPVLDKLLIK